MADDPKKPEAQKTPRVATRSRLESLEARILMSATWVDVDTAEAEPATADTNDPDLAHLVDLLDDGTSDLLNGTLTTNADDPTEDTRDDADPKSADDAPLVIRGLESLPATADGQLPAGVSSDIDQLRVSQISVDVDDGPPDGLIVQSISVDPDMGTDGEAPPSWDLDVAPVQGTLDTPIPLNIDVPVEEGVVLRIDGLPPQAELSAGELDGDGTWIVATSEVADLTLTTNSLVDFELELSLEREPETEPPAIATSGLTLESYGGSQDQTGTAEIDSDGTIELGGNVWKSLEMPFSITADTVIEFEFRSTHEGEIQGLGFDTDQTIGKEQTFQIYGTQNWGNSDVPQYDGDGEWQTIRIPVGEFMTGDFDRLILVNDDDASGDSDSAFRNLRVFEGPDYANEVLDTSTIDVEITAGLEIDVTPSVGVIGLEVPLAIDVEAPENARVLVHGVPASATLSQGELREDGSWELQVDQLDDLSLNGAEAGTFDLTVEVRAGDGPIATSATFSEDGLQDYGGSQDKFGDPVISADGSELQMEGNSWKQLDFPYEITEETYLEFEFRADGEGEIHGIGVDTDSSIGSDTTFRLHGGQNWGINDFADYEGDGEWQTFRIPVGDYLTGEIDRLVFVHDNDAADTDGSDVTSGFRNVRLVEPSLAEEEIESETVDVQVILNAPSPAGVSDVSGFEDAPIPLAIDLGTFPPSADTHVVIEGVPTGATLSAGTEVTEGRWIVDQADVPGLELNPVENSDADFDLEVSFETPTQVEVNFEDPGSFATQGGTASVGDDGVLSLASTAVDPPAIATFDVSPEGEEFSIHVELTNEGDLPYENGFIIFDYQGPNDFKYAGARDGADYWTIGHFDGDFRDQATLSETITTGQLYDLELKATGGTTTLYVDGVEKAQFDFNESLDGDVGVATHNAQSEFGEFSLSTYESVDIGTIHVEVDAVADVADLDLPEARTFLSGTSIPLEIGADLEDRDGSESLLITVAGVPEGAALSAGVEAETGVWTLTPQELSGLSMELPEGTSGDFSLSVTATTTENDGGESVEVQGDFDLTILAAEGDAELQDSSGLEDSPIPMSIELGPTAEHGATTVTIRGVPEGAQLSAGTEVAPGSWELSGADMPGLTLDPPANWSGEMALDVSITTEIEGLHVPGGTADPTELESYDGTAVFADGQFHLEATGTPTPVVALFDLEVDQEPFEVTTTMVTEHGLPYQNGFIIFDYEGPNDFKYAGARDGANYWTVGHFNGSFQDDFTLSENIVTGQPYDLSLSIEGGQATLTVDGVEKASFDFNEDLSGEVGLAAEKAIVNFTPPTVEVENAQDSAQVQQEDTIHLSVVGQADEAQLDVADSSGIEDSAIPLSIQAGLGNDTDGSESLTLTISGLPEGALLSAGQPDAQADGTWTLTPAELEGLTLTPGPNADADMTLTVTATSTEADGDQTSVDSTLTVTVQAEADDAIVSAGDVSGVEDKAIPLALSADLADQDGSESLELRLTGLPEGAALSAGELQEDGSWIIEPAQLEGLTLNPPADFSGEFTLSFVATTTEADSGDVAVVTQGFSVQVDGVADAPSLQLADAQGQEDRPIPLAIAVMTTDGDGSETLNVTLSGLPEGATLSAGQDLGGGIWELSPADLEGLTLTPPAQSDGDFTLQVTATSREADGDQSTTAQDVHITIVADADEASLKAENVHGLEDEPIPLDLGAGLTDADGSESLSLVLTGVPEGSTLSAGESLGDGSYRLTPSELSSLTITPPENYSGVFSMTLVATTTEAEDGAQAITARDFEVCVKGVADEATVDMDAASGLSGGTTALSLSWELGDLDGSESINIILSDLPPGAELSAGTPLDGDTWVLEPDDLEGLTIRTDSEVSGSFAIEATAVITESDGDTREVTTSATLEVSAAPLTSADEPTFEPQATSEGEDRGRVPAETATEENSARDEADSRVSVEYEGSTRASSGSDADTSFTERTGAEESGAGDPNDSVRSTATDGTQDFGVSSPSVGEFEGRPVLYELAPDDTWRGPDSPPEPTSPDAALDESDENEHRPAAKAGLFALLFSLFRARGGTDDEGTERRRSRRV